MNQLGSYEKEEKSDLHVKMTNSSLDFSDPKS